MLGQHKNALNTAPLMIEACEIRSGESNKVIQIYNHFTYL